MISMGCSSEDKIPTYERANTIRYVTYPRCQSNCIGKTDRNITCLNEHGTPKKQPMLQHLKSLDITSMMTFPDIESKSPVVRLANIFKQQSLITSRLLTSVAIGRNFFLEAFYIKQIQPKINDGLKASPKLVLCK